MTIAQKTNAMLRLIRPELPLSAGVCVVVGQAIALGRLPSLGVIGLGFGLGFFLSASAMVFNDYFDLEVDRINAPQRPLPAGLLTKPEAIAYGLTLGLIALIISTLIHPIVLIFSILTWIIGFLYNWKLKAGGIWGNLCVSYSVAMTFIMGGISVGQIANPMLWLFALIAFVFDFAEEIAGDAMDAAGDQKRGSKSIAILYGKATALRISSLLFWIMITLTLIPVFLGQMNLGYWLPILLMDVIILYFVNQLRRSRTPQEGHRAMRALYLSATLGLIAFVLTAFVP